MNSSSLVPTLMTIGILLAWSAPASAVEPAAKCEAGKLKEAAKYLSCRLKADAKAVTKSASADYSKCDEKLTIKFPALETKAGTGVCPTEGDVTAEKAALTTDEVATAWRLSAGRRFIDNGDGTITDRKTNLMWEKKIKLDSVKNMLDAHDADNKYTWANFCSISGKYCQPDADASARCFAQAEGDDKTGCDLCGAGEGTCSTVQTTIWTFIDVMNDVETFAGYSDWRIPTIRELESMRSDDLTKYGPAVDSELHGSLCGATCTDMATPQCSCTFAGYTWSGTNSPESWEHAWFVHFFEGYSECFPSYKDDLFVVRAVRGGS